jgi:lipopolysaccharide/colanic/teichoic acid biosynthesis glycosyltransferase
LRHRRPAKRAFDLGLSSLGIIVLSPLIAAIALRIRIDRDGPVLYRGTRVGLGSKEFKILKFRTMVANADRIGGPNTPDDDPRLTRTGRALRRHKLDELPQLFNVLGGSMSFVGPRPQVPEEVAGYTDEERLLLTVRPGITDWASLRFHNEGEILKSQPDPDRAYAELIRPEKMRLGLEYVRRGTLLDDINILVRTAALPLWRRSSTDAAAPGTPLESGY